MSDKPVCHERRHMTPSQFMTYDAMRAMAESLHKNGPYEDRVFYARLTTLTNHTSLSRNQNRKNIDDLIALGWVIPEERNRFRGGRFGTQRYRVLTHEQYERHRLRHDVTALGYVYKACPDFKYEAATGKILRPSPRPADRMRNGVSPFCGLPTASSRPADATADAVAMQGRMQGCTVTASSRPDTDRVQPTGCGPRPVDGHHRVQPTGHKPCLSP